MTYVVDIEADGLNPTKVHVLSAGYKKDGKWEIVSTNDYDKMRSLLTEPKNTIVGHNFKMFDAPALSRILDIEIKAEIIDTLPMAWYILPSRKRSYGLGAFGEDFGVPKPKIEDWDNLSYEEYKHRCEEDVKINIELFEKLSRDFFGVYGDVREVRRIIRYLMFKMDCIVDQERIGTKVDVEMVKENIKILESLRLPKEQALKESMPPGPVLKKKPAKMTKKDGTPSAAADKWYAYLRDNDLDLTTEVVYDEPNINSSNQIKDWLFDLGWKPTTFKEGANGKVPQVRNDKKDLCESVLELAKEHPAIESLDGLSVIAHRLAVLKAFLDTTDEEGYTIAGMSGFTNTLRLRHSRPIANLPGVTGKINADIKAGKSKIDAVSDNLRDGQLIRECIIAPEGYILCGSDITSLEDNTKRHYMWSYDPDYVKEQMREGFDPHLDLAVKAGAVEEDKVQEMKEAGTLKPIRDMYKMANYSCIYGVGAPKLADSIGISRKEAKKLIEAYWRRNWSIKQLPKDMKTKVVGEQMWLLNPVNNFWYSIRNEKDIFSTLNQGTGAFVFDCWVKMMRAEDVVPFLQYHDEVLCLLKDEDRDKVETILHDSMSKVNKSLDLNVEITVDVQFGNSYADVH